MTEAEKLARLGARLLESQFHIRRERERDRIALDVLRRAALNDTVADIQERTRRQVDSLPEFDLATELAKTRV